MDEQNYEPQLTGQQVSSNEGLLHQGNPDLIRWVESPQIRVDTFVKALAGKTWNEHTSEWESDPNDTVMNSSGERYIRTILKGSINTDTILTRIDSDDEIRRLAEPLMVRMTTHLHLFHKRYGIKKDYIPTLRELISNQIVLTLKRGLHQGERKFLNLRTQHDIRQVEQPRQSKIGNFMGGIFGR